MMKITKLYKSIYVLLLCVLSAIMSGCQEEIELPGTEPTMEMMPFRLHTNLSMASTNSRASIVGGGEQTINDVSDMILLCFDANGLFLGKYSLSSLTPEQSTGINLKGVIEGSVPISTCRIHFISNHNSMNLSQVPLGMHENTLMLSEHMAVDRTQDLCYWGYKCTESTDEMKSWLNSGNTIYLVRDRARVQLTSVSEVDSKGNPITGADVITRVEFIASHGLGKGYLAPFDRSKLDTNPFDGYITEDGNGIKYTPSFSPYENTKRYKLTKLNSKETSRMEVVPFDSINGFVTVYERNGDNVSFPPNYIYLFEDPNELPLDEDDTRMPVKLILKVTYADGAVRYHTVLIMDQSNYEQYRITRNYTYDIRINMLPKELGNLWFESAVNSTSYSNNQLLEVSKVVTDVSNGTYMLCIKGTHGTSTLYNKRDDDGKVRLDFEYKQMVAGTEQPVDVGPDNFTVKWLEVYDELVSDIDPSRVEITYDNTTGCGQLIIPINEVTSYMRSGQLLLTDKKVGLARYIFVYAINYFDLSQTNVKLEQTDITLGGKNVYKLSFTVPDDYPNGMYPLNFQFSTRYLNAFATNYADGNFTTEAAFSVNVSSTDPAKPENLGLESSTSTNTWNYDAAAWNYWYTYSLPARRVVDNNDGEEENKIHTVYLQDVTSSFSSITNLTELGVFYRIQYFSYKEGSTTKNVNSVTCARK